MNQLKHVISLVLLVILLQGCKVSYSFTGADIGNAQSFQVNNFINNAPIVEPSVARNLTLELQDLILNQTSLGLVTNGGDLVYEGEIVQYYVSPITATSQSTAAQNRLTVAVNVRFFNTLEPEKDFEERFSFYFDYPGSSQLIGSQLTDALDVIYERLTQDIFNKSLANW
ncbi:MAG: LptE family protein [Flavobacteriaceae bacterium]|nr:LptE family protein [Flavobacteriaceae bacterium]